MVAHFTMGTYGVNQAFRFVEGIWFMIYDMSSNLIFFRKKPILHHTCATCSEQPSYISSMVSVLYLPIIPVCSSLSISTSFSGTDDLQVYYLKPCRNHHSPHGKERSRYLSLTKFPPFKTCYFDLSKAFECIDDNIDCCRREEFMRSLHLQV